MALFGEIVAAGSVPEHIEDASRPRHLRADLGLWDGPKVFPVGGFDGLAAMHATRDRTKPVEVHSDAWRPRRGLDWRASGTKDWKHRFDFPEPLPGSKFAANYPSAPYQDVSFWDWPTMGADIDQLIAEEWFEGNDRPRIWLGRRDKPSEAAAWWSTYHWLSDRINALMVRLHALNQWDALHVLYPIVWERMQTPGIYSGDPKPPTKVYGAGAMAGPMGLFRTCHAIVDVIDFPAETPRNFGHMGWAGWSTWSSARRDELVEQFEDPEHLSAIMQSRVDDRAKMGVPSPSRALPYVAYMPYWWIYHALPVSTDIFDKANYGDFPKGAWQGHPIDLSTWGITHGRVVVRGGLRPPKSKLSVIAGSVLEQAVGVGLGVIFGGALASIAAGAVGSTAGTGAALVSEVASAAGKAGVSNIVSGADFGESLKASLIGDFDLGQALQQVEAMGLTQWLDGLAPALDWGQGMLDTAGSIIDTGQAASDLVDSLKGKPPSKPPAPQPAPALSPSGQGSPWLPPANPVPNNSLVSAAGGGASNGGASENVLVASNASGVAVSNAVLLAGAGLIVAFLALR